MVSPDEFTIGWICALPLELAAAASLLDEEFEAPNISRYDPNGYILGRIAEHRVAITCLRSGVAAAGVSVAAHMVRTFMNMRFVLLVGIGGGLPSPNHDVRLGDIVVGRSVGNNPGVVQYDLGRLIGDNRLEWLGALNQPPQVLLTALSMIEARHRFEEPKFVNYASEVAARTRATTRAWSHPGARHDLLYTSQYPHCMGHDDCSHCDPSRLVAREPRVSQAPHVHYGPIGSGNSTIKDAEIRDKLSGRTGILCFETDAAGMVNDLPCLVIKGICDYCDSHKNKIWQSYAACVAAAYAKELLHYVKLDQVGSAVPVIDHLDLDASQHTEDGLASTSSATMVGDSDNEVINKAAERIGETIASDQRLKALLDACVSRMTAPVFQRRIIPVLFRYGINMKKSVHTPMGQSLAFVLRHRKQLISFFIRNLIFGAQGAMGDETSHLGIMSKDETERLRHLIQSRFSRVHSQGAQQVRHDEPEVEITEGANDADPDEGIDEMAPSVSEIDPENIAPVLRSGEPYWEAYRELKLLAFPATEQELTRVLERHISSDGSLVAINCLIQWEVLEFMDTEKILVSDLDSVFTLTGTFDRAAAYRLGDYMRQRWNTGGAILDTFKNLVGPHLNDVRAGTHSEEVNATIGPDHEVHIQVIESAETEKALLQVKGSFNQISETLEQFAWLATTLRPGTGGALTVSEIKFQFVNPSDQLFELSLLEQSGNRRPDPNEPGQCWTSLFTESNLAYGFSLCEDDRPDEMLGLEIPFLPMAAFAGVRYPIDSAGRTVLAGTSTLLTPVISSGNCIQWHYSKGEDRFNDCRQHVKVLDPQLQTMAWDQLIEARAFLGYASNAEIFLGAKYPPGSDISESKVPRAGGRLSLIMEGPIVMEVSPTGWFKLGVGATWKASRAGERAQLEAHQRTLIDYIRPSQHTPALLYDYEAARAFLVPELSIILHMASAYLRTCSSLPPDQIPNTEPCPNSGEAALRVVQQHQNAMIPFSIGEDRKYSDVIQDFVTIWEQRKLQMSARQNEFNLHLSSSIRGWDFVDMQLKRPEFFEREIPTSLLLRPTQPIWWKVFAKQPCMVVFGGNIGCPIRKVAHGINQPYCNAWADIPTGKHLLIANVASLTQLMATCCSQSQPNSRNRHYRMITDELAWARPRASTLFQPCRQGDSCTPVQTMSKVGGWHLWDKSNHRTPGEDTAAYQNGAVLFADDPTDFAPRPCSFVFPVPPDPGPVNTAPPNSLTAPSPAIHISVICYILGGSFGLVYMLSRILSLF